MRIIIIGFLLFYCTSSNAQSPKEQFGFHVAPHLEIHELGSEITLSAGFYAGFHYRRFHYSAYYTQTTQAFTPNQGELSVSDLEIRFSERSLGCSYHHPTNEYLRVIIGIRIGDGTITSKYDLNGQAMEDSDQVFQFRPEIGTSIRLNPSMLLYFSVGYRSVYGIDNGLFLDQKDINSISSNVGLSFVF